MNYITRIWVIAALALMVALALACGGGGGHKTPVAPIILPPPVDTNPDVEEVQNTPVPQGVDAAVWATLTTELVSQLETMTEEDRDPIEFDWRDTGIGVAWDNSFMRPDGNDDGRVDVLDLVPLAEHFGEEWNNSDGPIYADYEHDKVINLADVAWVARNYGLTCGGFQVEFSTQSADAGFVVAGTVNYGDYYYMDSTSLSRQYRFACETRGLEPLWARITALDSDGAVLGTQVWDAPITENPRPADFGYMTSQPALLSSQPPIITWSTEKLIHDGNQDGVVNRFEVGAMADWFGARTSEEPQCAVADFDGNGVIGISDLEAAGMRWSMTIENFIVQVSTTSADEGFTPNGTVAYFDSTGFNAGGFRYYNYEIASPPAGVTFWVRVVPVGYDGTSGDPSDAVEFVGSSSQPL
jgi:hypothetical protein